MARVIGEFGKPGAARFAAFRLAVAARSLVRPYRSVL